MQMAKIYRTEACGAPYESMLSLLSNEKTGAATVGSVKMGAGALKTGAAGALNTGAGTKLSKATGAGAAT